MQIGSGFTQRLYYWTDFKNIVQKKTMSIQYEINQSDLSYILWAYDGPDIHLCTIYDGYVPQNLIDNEIYSQSQNNSDLNDWIINYLPSANLPIIPRLADGRSRTSSEKTNQSRITFYSPNWCDKTTWYFQSICAHNEIVLLNIDGYYHLEHNYIIDTYHGNITLEDTLKDTDGYSYRVSVVVDGYVKTEQDPHYADGGDYIVDYINGIIFPITNWNPQNSNSVVITYHYATTSTFIITPIPGKSLLINMAECQFSTDVIMTDTVSFQVVGYAGVFAPQLGYPYTTLIPLTNFKYKSMSDLMNDSIKSYPIYPVLGGNGWRGMASPTTIFSWEYVSSTTISSSSGMQIIISLDHNTAFGGNYATVTFYCTSE